jgi:ATP-dependent DNA helicase RecG
MSFSFLQTSPQWIPGIGPTFGKRLSDSGYRTFFDVLTCLPSKYIVYSHDQIPTQGPVYIEIQVGHMQGRNPWKIPCTTHCGRQLELVFFQRPKPIWIPGQKVWIKGIVQCTSYGMAQIAHPERVAPWPLSPGEIRIVPEYTLPKGVTQTRFSAWIKHILTHWPDTTWSPVLHDPHSGKNTEQHEWWDAPNLIDIPSHRAALENSDVTKGQDMTLSWHTCFTQAHFPQSIDMTGKTASWRACLAHSEWIAKHLASASVRISERDSRPSPICAAHDTSAHDHFLQHFGHELTPSQQTAWSTISQDLTLKTPMMRLLNGDVGSGKTLIAFLAMIQVAASGHQACLMAPTETLIRQHFACLTQWLHDIPVQLILGKGHRIGPSDAPIVLGTHALFYDKVQFEKLALVVIDEQQRFGVEQRLSLMQKGMNPHVLFLSATPIPRTFQRLVCADMDVSIIEKRPSHIPLTSYIVSSEKLNDLQPWIQKCLDQQECIYWVCPAIDDEDIGVHMRYAYWDAIFPNRVGYLHGRMSAQEKDHVMDDFRTGQKPILIATTVIEVGIHVSQASTIFIEESPSFGLSQLHQLRGRVGRDDIPGHCFFLYNPPLTAPARQRLTLMRQCQDGFKIAEKDWLWRGAGTQLGTQQSGHALARFIQMEQHHYLAVSSLPDAEYMMSHHPDASQSLISLFGYSGKEILAAG